MLRTRNSTRQSLSTPAIPVVLASIVATAIAVAIGFSSPPGGTGADVDARSAGAGTFPDGVADEFQEGMRNETSTSDFLDSGAATDAVSPLLESDDGGAPQKTDAATIEGVPERMLDQGG